MSARRSLSVAWWAGAATLALTVASCGGGQTHPTLFATDWEDDNGASIEAVRVHLAGAAASAPPGADVAVAVSGHGDKLIGVPFGGGPRWFFGHPIDSRPAVAGGVVVAAGGSEVFALDAVTGRKLWARDTGGLALRGAGDDGSVTVMTFSPAAGKGAVILAVQRDGTSVRQIETDKDLGAPAVVQGFAFVPWGQQYVTVIDLATGDEVARVTVRETTSHAWTSGGSLYFGELGFFRLDDRIRGASHGKATHLSTPTREYAGTPVLMFPGGAPLPPISSARDKVRLFARPDGAEALALQDGRAYASYFRYAMGFDTKSTPSGALAWVKTLPSDIIGGAAAVGGVALCDELGKVVLLDASTGNKVGELDLGEPVKSCTVSVDAFRIVSPTPSGDDRPLVAELEDAIRLAPPGMTAAQRLFLRELASAPDESATKALLMAATDAATPDELRRDIGAALANRRSGAALLLEALRSPYDYLKNVLVTPPVAAIAEALAAMKATGAAALLAPYLLDPSSRDEDVKQVARALVVLAEKPELAAVKQFFGMYRATAESLEISDAVVSAATILLKLGGGEERALVELAANDSMTAPAARDQLAALVTAAASRRASGVGDAGGGTKAASDAGGVGVGADAR